MTPCGMANPCPCSRKKRMTPSAAASPKALPPASSRPCTVSTCDSGRMSSVSRQPGANPGTAMPGVKPCGQRMAVQPVWFRSSVAWPASRPSMAVRVVLLMGTPVAEVGSCARATIRLLPGEGAWDKSFMFTRKRKASLVGDAVRSPGRTGKGRTTGLVRAGRQVPVRSGDIFGGRGGHLTEEAKDPPGRIPVPENDRAPRERNVRRGAPCFSADAADQASMSRKYWCRRRSGVSSGWKDVASTLP